MPGAPQPQACTLAYMGALLPEPLSLDPTQCSSLRGHVLPGSTLSPVPNNQPSLALVSSALPVMLPHCSAPQVRNRGMMLEGASPEPHQGPGS